MLQKFQRQAQLAFARHLFDALLHQKDPSRSSRTKMLCSRAGLQFRQLSPKWQQVRLGLSRLLVSNGKRWSPNPERPAQPVRKYFFYHPTTMLSKGRITARCEKLKYTYSTVLNNHFLFTVEKKTNFRSPTESRSSRKQSRLASSHSAPSR